MDEILTANKNYMWVKDPGEEQQNVKILTPKGAKIMLFDEWLTNLVVSW